MSGNNFHLRPGGLVSTARDYMHFFQMMINQGEISGIPLVAASNGCNDDLQTIVATGLSNSIWLESTIPRGFGSSIVVEELKLAPYVSIGEYGWGGAVCTHFWISPEVELAVIVLTQYMSFFLPLGIASKFIVYQVILDTKRTQGGLQ